MEPKSSWPRIHIHFGLYFIRLRVNVWFEQTKCGGKHMTETTPLCFSLFNRISVPTEEEDDHCLINEMILLA